MNDPLEEFVRKNRQEFDSERPSERSWNQIKMDLPLKPSKIRTISMPRKWIYAAASILALAAAVIVFQGIQLRTLKQSADLPAEEVNEQVQTDWELPAQLTSLDQQLKAQEAYSSDFLSDFPEESDDLNVELSELENEFERLKEELGHQYAPDEILEAMEENYRIKLELIEATLQHIRQSNKVIENEEISL